MFVISSRYTDVQQVFSQRPFQIHINKTKHCVDMTWYSCPGPVLARIISLPLQCSTWYRRPSWRCWTCKGLRWDVATSTSKTSEVVLLLQLMLSICWSLERATSTNTLERRQSFHLRLFGSRCNVGTTAVLLTLDVFLHTQSLSRFPCWPSSDGRLCCSVEPPELCRTGHHLWPILQPYAHTQHSFRTSLIYRSKHHLKPTKAEDFIQRQHNVWWCQGRRIGFSKLHNHTPVFLQCDYPLNNLENLPI